MAAASSAGKFAKWLAANVGDSGLPRLRASGYNWEATGEAGKRMRQVIKMLGDLTPDEATVASKFSRSPNELRRAFALNIPSANIPENTAMYNAYKRATAGAVAGADKAPYVFPEFRDAAMTAANEGRLVTKAVNEATRPLRAVGIYRKLEPPAQKALLEIIDAEAAVRPGKQIPGLTGRHILAAREIGRLGEPFTSLATAFMRQGMTMEEALAAARALS
jgi:hypothetical protein